ncbi:unnamed protein product [Brassica oleracea]
MLLLSTYIFFLVSRFMVCSIIHIVIFDGDQGQWVGCLVTQYYIRCCLASLAGVSAVDDVPPDSYVLRSMSRRPRS